MIHLTYDGHVKTISQIFYGQYHIWNLFGIYKFQAWNPKFFLKTTTKYLLRTMDKGTQSAKYCNY